MIAFYYLLRIGEYTTKGSRNNSKQIQELTLGDITFFKRDKQGTLQCLPRDAASDLIETADSATMKLDNQRMGGRECVSTKKRTETRLIARYGH